MGWQEDHDRQWENENRRARQEKHEEKYWSEIKDGLCSKKAPEGSGKPLKTSTLKFLPDSAPLADRLAELAEHFKKRKLDKT